MTAAEICRDEGGMSVRQTARRLGVHERTMYKVHAADPNKLRLMVRRALYAAGETSWRDELARLGGIDQCDDKALAAIKAVAFITEDPTCDT